LQVVDHQQHGLTMLEAGVVQQCAGGVEQIAPFEFWAERGGDRRLESMPCRVGKQPGERVALHAGEGLEPGG
jgi:hypothetical protein